MGSKGREAFDGSGRCAEGSKLQHRCTPCKAAGRTAHLAITHPSTQPEVRQNRWFTLASCAGSCRRAMRRYTSCCVVMLSWVMGNSARTPGGEGTSAARVWQEDIVHLSLGQGAGHGRGGILCWPEPHACRLPTTHPTLNSLFSPPCHPPSPSSSRICRLVLYSRSAATSPVSMNRQSAGRGGAGRLLVLATRGVACRDGAAAKHDGDMHSS